MNLMKSENTELESNRVEKPINQWVRVNKLLAAYRYALIALSTSVFGFFLVIAYLVNRDTLVVMVGNDSKQFVRGQRKEPTITESDVESLSRLFITTRYTWGANHGENIAKDLAPLTSDGLLQKINTGLTKNKAVMQQTSQDVIVREIRPEEGKVFVLVDRIVQVSDKMKVVSPLELTLTLIRGSSNRWNPLGLYVNSLIEHESE